MKPKGYVCVSELIYIQNDRDVNIYWFSTRYAVTRQLRWECFGWNPQENLRPICDWLPGIYKKASADQSSMHHKICNLTLCIQFNIDDNHEARAKWTPHDMQIMFMRIKK